MVREQVVGEPSIMDDWEDQFKRWARPPGTTEQQRCENAESAIRNAVSASSSLSVRNCRTFTHGSYRNRTNVRKDSDVDIFILCTDTLIDDFPKGYTREDFGLEPASFRYNTFKDDVENALVNHFGRSAVTRGHKAIDIRETTYHVEADVVPVFEHRRYMTNGNYLEGVAFRPDSGGRVKNWPEQHYENGVDKNNDTRRRYKAMVRILKALCHEMQEAGIFAATPIPGFLIECLVWNVPNDRFGYPSLSGDVRASLAYLFNNTMDNKDCSEWGEVSELIYLFHSGQKWTRSLAHNFISAAWDYLGLE